MLRGLGAYLRERYPVAVSLPLAGVLGAASTPGPPDRSTLGLSMAIWLLLFAARALDDIADLAVDRQRRPGAALPAGLISARALGGVAAIAWLLAVALTAWCAPSAAVLPLAGAAGLAVYYRWRPRIPHALHFPWVNSTFAIVMLIGPLGNARSPAHGALLAGFVWIAVIAHDLAHGIEDAPAARPRAMLSAVGRARSGAACFAAASVLGGLHALRTLDPWFALALAATSAWMAVLLARLLRDPVEAVARRIYVPGFLYFLLPLLASTAGRALA